MSRNKPHRMRSRRYKQRHSRRKASSRKDWYQDMQWRPCHYCGIEPAEGVDHKVPISKGGSLSQENCVPCCPPCNSKKGNIPYADFIDAYGFWPYKEGRKQYRRLQ